MKTATEKAFLLVFVAVTAAVIILIPRNWDYYDTMHLGVILGLCAAVVLLSKGLVTEHGVTLRWNRVFTWFSIFMAVALISCLFAGSQLSALRTWCEFALFGIFCYLMFLRLCKEENPGRVLWMISLTAAVFSAHGIAQFTGLYPAHALAHAMGHNPLAPVRHDFLSGFRVYSIFGNRNLLADYLAVSLPASLALWLCAQRTHTRVFHVLSLVLCVCCLGLAGSRNAIIGAGAGVSVVILLLLIKRMRASAPMIVLLVGVAAATVLSVTVIGQRQFKKDSLRLRMISWGATMEMVRDNPITGVGPDRFHHEHLTYQAEYFKNPSNRKYAYLVNMEKQRNAHNEFLQVAAETGIPGFIVFLCLVGCLALGLWRSVSATQDPVAGDLALCGAFTSLAVVSCFGFPLRIPQTAALTALLVATASAQLHSRGMISAGNFQNVFRNFFASPRRRAECILAICLVAFLTAMELGVDPYRSSVFFYRGVTQIRNNKLRQADKMCLQAFRLDTLNGNARYCLGIIYLKLRHPEDALHQFDETLRLTDDPEIRFNRARALESLKKYPEAEGELKTILGMTPDYLKPHLELAALYEKSDRAVDAREQYGSCIELMLSEEKRQGSNPDRAMLLARLYLKIGDRQNYLLWLQKSGK